MWKLGMGNGLSLNFLNGVKLLIRVFFRKLVISWSLELIFRIEDKLEC